MKLCSKCKKRPAVVFMSDMSNPNAEPSGLCLVCANAKRDRFYNQHYKSGCRSDNAVKQERGKPFYQEGCYDNASAHQKHQYATENVCAKDFSCRNTHQCEDYAKGIRANDTEDNPSIQCAA